MSGISKLLGGVKSYIFNRSFVLGMAIAVGVLSPYIFGHDNLAEELAEMVLYYHTGKDIDLSPTSTEQSADSMKQLLELIKHRRGM